MDNDEGRQGSPSVKGTLQYFEDFSEAARYDYTVVGVSVEEIKEFARRYDPQRFHLDEDEAERTHFGQLVASGFQTQLLCFKGFCDLVLQRAAAIGAPGIDTIQWKRPWYPDQKLNVSVSLLNKRLSTKKPDRGYIRFRLVACADINEIFIMEWAAIMLTKSAVGR